MLVGVPAAGAAGSKLITGNDVKNGSLTAKDISPSTLNSWKDYFKGEKGDTGPMGPIGVTGVKGDDGAKGATGDRGPVGPAGVGINGADGANGEDGKPGAQGPAGPAGSNGDAGPQGERGERGLPGAKGEPGVNGKDGSAVGYEHNLQVVSITNASAPTTVKCPAGKVALSGSGMTSGAGTGAILSLSFPDFGPSGDAPPSGWTFKYTNVIPGPQGAKATFAVICANA